MSQLQSNALLAVLAGGLISLLLFVPLVASQYRRWGRASTLRILGWIAFLVYINALWTYTLLPIPDSLDYRCAAPILSLGHTVADIGDYPTGSLGEILRNPAVQQLGFNVVLFIPLGFFVRALFRRGLLVATLIGCATSLVIEFTQLTGVWGLFPCAYRFFDVGDLATNTLGAFLGSLLGVLVLRRRARGDASAPTPVTSGRRLLGMLCDLLLITLVGSGANLAWRLLSVGLGNTPLDQIDARAETLLLWGLPFALQACSVLFSGVTLGERAVLLASKPGRLPSWIARPIRLLAGIGGYTILLWATFPGSGILLFALIAASIVAVWLTRGHRGFACLLAGMTIADRRATQPEGDGDTSNSLSAERGSLGT